MINSPLVILAGGMGTRLKSVTNDIPKALADINGIPFLYYLLDNWVKNGFTHFIFSLYYQADMIIDYVEQHKLDLLKNCKVEYVVEPQLLGTGGAVAHVVKNLKLKGDFFVANADTWVKSGYSDIYKVMGNVIGVVHVNDTGRYGRVILDEFQRIVKFEEKTVIGSSGVINAGVYKLNAKLFLLWDGKPFSIERDLFPLLLKNDSLVGVQLNSSFIDIGIPIDYFEFCSWKIL